MMPLVMSPEMLSKAIRAKKKKLATEEPEMVGTSPVPDMNAQDVYDMDQAARIESTLDTPEKINSDEANLDMDDNVGPSEEDMKRMARLRMYFQGLNMWARGE